MNKGKLFLIPTPLGEVLPVQVLPSINIRIIHSISHFIVEETRTARRFLKKCEFPRPFDDVTFLELNEHTSEQETIQYLDAALQGDSIGLMSEAGLPCIADPGHIMVRRAHELLIQVVPLTGPSSIMLALMASGLNGQHFIFHGYLPVKPAERNHKLKEIETDTIRSGKTHIFIEAPYRNQNLFEAILSVGHPQTMLCIAVDISLDSESIRTITIGEWRKNIPALHKRPAVFLLGI